MKNAFDKVIKTHIKLSILSVIAVILLMTGVTYSLWQIDHKNTTDQSISGGNLAVDLSSTTGTITITDITPTKQSDLTSDQNRYDFKISNTGDYYISYTVYLTNNTASVLPSYPSYTAFPTTAYSSMDYAIDGGTQNNLGAVLNTSNNRMVIMSGSLGAGTSEDHYIQFWLDENAPNNVIGTLLSLNINMEATAAQNPADKTLANLDQTVKTETPDFSQIEPRIASYTDNGFSTSTLTYNLSSSYTTRYFTYASSYTYNTATNTYTLVSPTTAVYSSCYTSLPGKYVVSYYGTSSSSGSSYANVSTIYKVTNATYDSSALTGVITRNNLNTRTVAEWDSSLSGLYSAPDDYGTSYYYRGNVTNNYVQFAGFYWRIIRINGDGSLRMIYDGTSAHANGESSMNRQIGTSPFNTNRDDNVYVGYMYGQTGASTYAATHANTNSSTIKTYIDAWYKTNIVDTGNSSAVADVIYCNDREIDTTAGGSYTNLGYGTNQTAYMGRNRLYRNKTPKLSCTQKNDAFTVADEETGNGALTYPVGLITADELSYAGKAFSTSNSSDYLYTGTWFWGLSPYFVDSGYANVISAYGYMSNDSVYSTGGVRPVILLSAEYCENLVGDGTSTNPYHT